MLKGVERSVVVVSDIKSGLFEQAIFILTPKGASGYINDSEAVVKEARAVLKQYSARYYAAQKLRRKRARKGRRGILKWAMISLAISAALTVCVHFAGML